MKTLRSKRREVEVLTVSLTNVGGAERGGGLVMMDSAPIAFSEATNLLRLLLRLN